MSKQMVFRNGKGVFLIDGEEVTREEFDQGWKVEPPDYEAGECCTVRADLNDFSMENRGKGRYNPQMAKMPNDPDAYFTSVNAVKDEASRRGMSTET
jgi:hypothetical protein